MSEVPNLTEHLSKLRDRREGALFELGQGTPQPRGNQPPSKPVATQPVRRFRASTFSWFAAGICIVLVAAQIAAAFLFSIR